MGRSSGSSGGGHSSGGFGGGHSSGGFSGGGRSSGGSFGGSSGGGWHSSSGPRRGPIFMGGPHYYGGGYYGGPGGYRSSLVGTVIAIVIIMMLITILPNIFNAMFSSTKVPKNKTERTALSGVVAKTDWYQDDIGWVSSKNVLIAGLEDFYKQTGVQPYILFVPYSNEYWNGSTINATKADQYLEQVYSKKFKDEGHFIFAYFQCQNDTKSEMDGEFRYLSGYSAETIMDNEAISILWGYFEKNYYDTSLSLEKMISNTFSETAKSIMDKPTNGWDFLVVLIIIILVIIIIIVIYKVIKSKHQREKEKEEYTKEILDKPLETFGENTSEIEKKYEE